ncbi:MAG: response regulator [Bacillota bacterium]
MASVLIIDDEPIIAKVLEELLTEEGFQVVSVNNGDAGLELIRQGFIPGIILVDLFLPGIGGREFVEILRFQMGFHDIPVVLLTGSRPGSFGPSLANTFQAIIFKPFDITEVIQVIHQLIKEYPSMENSLC